MFLRLKKILLFIGDIIILYASLWLALLIRYQTLPDYQQLQNHFWPFTIVYVIWLLIFYISGLYDLGFCRTSSAFFTLFFRVVLINAGLAIAYFYLATTGITPKTNLFINIIVSGFLFSLWRFSFNRLLLTSFFQNNTLVLGFNERCHEVAKLLQEKPQLGYKIAGLACLPLSTPPLPSLAILPQLGDLPDLPKFIKQHRIKTIITAIDPREHHELVSFLYQCLPLRVEIINLPTFYERLSSKVPIAVINEIWFLENLLEAQKGIYETIKRIFDVIAAFIVAIIAIPLIPFIAIAIKLNSPGPLLFRQFRCGKNGKPFLAIKFRTMIVGAEQQGAQWAQKNDPRITRVGHFLRKTHLDEIPQLWNIFKGEMSCVGPRPERPEFVSELEKQIPYYQIRHLVRPGVTGWAQLCFPYAASSEDALKKLQYEVFYIKNRSLFLDLKIILKTLKLIINREGR